MEFNKIDNNQIVTIKYKNLEFELDMIDDILFLPEDIVELFTNDNIETQPTNLFFRRLIDNWELKNKIQVL